MSEVCLVTGGGGFVGKELSKFLLANGYQVRSLARNYYSELDKLGITQFQHDLGSTDSIPSEALKGVSIVFHTAALVKMWGAYQDFFKVNVLGTRKLLNAAKIAKVDRFIYTSSPSVIADGSNLCGINEDYPYPDKANKHFTAFYPQTKAIAEQEVLAENTEDFFTCALRPHLIFGPGDTNLIPTVLEKAKSGSLKRIGRGANKADFTFIDDCVLAHLKAAEALKSNPAARGKAYFISQGEPYNLWLWIDKVLVANKLSPLPNRPVSYRLAMSLAGIFEFLAKTLPFVIKEPRLTRFLVSEMATDHYFDLSRAKDLLGFEPRYTIDQALKLTFKGKGQDVNFNHQLNIEMEKVSAHL
jgi:nucleoside-diphosphate-sugar epimerase